MLSSSTTSGRCRATCRRIHGPAATGSGNGTAGHRDEPHARAEPGSERGDPLVVEVAAGERGGVAERDQRDASARADRPRRPHALRRRRTAGRRRALSGRAGPRPRPPRRRRAGDLRVPPRRPPSTAPGCASARCARSGTCGGTRCTRSPRSCPGRSTTPTSCTPTTPGARPAGWRPSRRSCGGGAVVTTDHGLGGGGWLGLLPALFDRFLTVSRFSAEVLGVPAHRTRVVYGGADEQRFAPDPDRRRGGVLFVGRLTPHKGIDRLIRALPDRARLTVAGTGGHDARPPERDYPDLLRRLARRPGRRLPRRGARRRPARAPSQRGGLRAADGQGRLLRPALRHLRAARAQRARGDGQRDTGDREPSRRAARGRPERGDRFPRDAGRRRRAAGPRRANCWGSRAWPPGWGPRGRDLVLEQFTWDACAQRCLAAYDELLAPPAQSGAV